MYKVKIIYSSPCSVPCLMQVYTNQIVPLYICTNMHMHICMYVEDMYIYF